MTAYVNYPAMFNGAELTSISGLTILATNPYLMPKRKLTMANLSQSNNAKVSSAFYNEKNILVRVGITRTTRALLEASLDSLWIILDLIEGELIINQGITRRLYYATLSDSIVSKDGGSYIEMDLIFSCSDRFGYDLASTLLLQVSGATAAVRTDTVTVSGSAPWQVPVITLTYTAITGGTTKKVTIGNSGTRQEVSIVRTWTAGDVVAIDSFNKTVKVNGAIVDFTGAIPEWAPGTGFLHYSDEFTTRTYSSTTNYVKRYV